MSLGLSQKKNEYQHYNLISCNIEVSKEWFGCYIARFLIEKHIQCEKGYFCNETRFHRVFTVNSGCDMYTTALSWQQHKTSYFDTDSMERFITFMTLS